MKSVATKTTVAVVATLTCAILAAIFLTGTSRTRADRAFLEEMIPHHEEAIASSKELLEISKNPELNQIASAVVNAQDEEVSQMKTWFRNWYKEEYAPTGVYKPMMKSMAGLSSLGAEAQYASDMITHHEHAVNMAKNLSKTTKRPELKQLISDVIRTQTSEIDNLKRILTNTYGKQAPVVDHSMH